MRSIAGILGLIVFLVILWFGSWFDNAANKALSACSAVEQMRGECEPPPTNDGRPIRIDDAPIP